MYKFDVFKNKKKVGTHKYSTLEEAEDAKFSVSHMPEMEYTYVPREGAKKVTKTLGGYKTSSIIEE